MWGVLMIINGQPLTTAEYIQASSRVGEAKFPASYSPIIIATRHEARRTTKVFVHITIAFYRFVEPTSVALYPTTGAFTRPSCRIGRRHSATLGKRDAVGNQQGAGDFDRAMHWFIKPLIA